MAAILAANVTVVVTERLVQGTKRLCFGTLAFGDGALTYSTAGILLPAIGFFGFYRQMDMLNIFGLNARTSDYLPSWVKATNALQLWVETTVATDQQLIEASAAAAPAARTYNWEAWGW